MVEELFFFILITDRFKTSLVSIVEEGAYLYPQATNQLS